MSRCVLFERECIDCGACDKCPIYDRICINCFECLEDGKTDADYAKIEIDHIEVPAQSAKD